MINQLISEIKKARLYDVVKKTSIDSLSVISERLDNKIYLKREDLQSVHSFKIRGALNKIMQLSDDEKKRGIITSSAGNHAQGVALSAQKCNISATIVMPITTPQIKVDSVKRFGATVILYGDSYDESYFYALEKSKENKSVFVHAFDDLLVIAGQGTIGIEILDQLENLDYLFLPVGGGGLFAGVAAYVKSLKPSVKIIAVEPEDSNCFEVALKNNEPTSLDHVGIFADGVAVKRMGELTFKFAKELLDDIVTVTTDEICAGIKDIYDDIRAIAEPSGALSLAGMKRYVAANNIKNKICLGILCGANVNFHRLRHISERSEIGEKKEILLSLSLPETKGSFLNVGTYLSKYSITECNYRFNNHQVAHVFVGLSIQSIEEKEQILAELSLVFPHVVDLTYNELAKLHIRYMIGGKVSKKESVYRFQFPEKPGALLQFLTALGTDFNITMFHYRNHGAAYGRVLVGIEALPGQKSYLMESISQLGYVFFDETDNEAVSLFL